MAAAAPAGQGSFLKLWGPRGGGAGDQQELLSPSSGPAGAGRGPRGGSAAGAMPAENFPAPEGGSRRRARFDIDQIGITKTRRNEETIKWIEGEADPRSTAPGGPGLPRCLKQGGQRCPVAGRSGPKGTRSRRGAGPSGAGPLPARPSPGSAAGSWRRPTCQARPGPPRPAPGCGRARTKEGGRPAPRSPGAGPAVHPLLLAHRLQRDVVRHVARLDRRAPSAAWAAARSGLRATARRRRAAPGEEAAAAGGPGPQRRGELASAGPRAEPPARPDRRTRAHHGPELRAPPARPRRACHGGRPAGPARGRRIS